MPLLLQLLENIGSGALQHHSHKLNMIQLSLLEQTHAVNHPVAATFIKNAAQRGADLFCS